MPYHPPADLAKMGFKSLGRNVRISTTAAIYDANQMVIGDNTRIDDLCVVSGRLTIGRNVHITPMCLIAAGQEGLTIGDFATLAYGVQVFTQSDDYSGETMTNSTVPAAYKNERKVAMMIGRHVIIGAGATIMPGADLAEGTAVGARSLVLQPTMSWGIYIGIPARRLKERSRALLDLERRYLEEEARS